jgi:hypothetical protein
MRPRGSSESSWFFGEISKYFEPRGISWHIDEGLLPRPAKCMNDDAKEHYHFPLAQKSANKPLQGLRISGFGQTARARDGPGSAASRRR